MKLPVNAGKSANAENAQKKNNDEQGQKIENEFIAQTELEHGGPESD
ncbi:hypothetical protein [Candidatus Electronema sp. JM]